LVELHGGTIDIASVHLPEERVCREEYALAV